MPISFASKCVDTLKKNSGFGPVSKYETKTPVTEDTNKGARDAIVSSNMKTSNTNTVPVIGALNIADSAAAVAQPKISNRCLKLRCNKRPKLLPIAAPVTTVGPSNPALPPNPTVIAEPITDEYMLCALITAPSLDIEYNTRGIPPEILCLSI